MCCQRGRSVACVYQFYGSSGPTGVLLIGMTMHTRSDMVYPTTWVWKLRDSGTWREQRHPIGLQRPSQREQATSSQKPQKAHSRYLHEDMRAQRPIKACQWPWLAVPCDCAAISCCRVRAISILVHARWRPAKVMYLDKFEALDQPPRKPSVTQIAQLQACNRHGGEIWSKGTRGRSCRGAQAWAWDVCRGRRMAAAGTRAALMAQ